MPLLDPTPDERALAAKILGEETAVEPAAPEPKASSEEPKAEPEGEKPAEKDAVAATPGDAAGDDTSDDPAWYRKRISQLTRKLRDAEQTMTAREMARDGEMRQMQAELAELKKQRETPAPPTGDSTPEEVNAYWERKLEAERLEAMKQRMADRLELQMESQRDKHDGTDGKPSYDELYERYAPIIDQLPAYVTVKARIQQAPNMPREFYRQAVKIWQDEQKEVSAGEEKLEEERDAGRSPRATTASRGPSLSEAPTAYEREMTRKVFGDRVKPEDIAKERVRMARERR